MMFTNVLVALAAMVARPALAIPPPEFGFPDSDNHTELSVAFTFAGNTTVVQEAQLFGNNITSSQPVLAVDPAAFQSLADFTGQYVVIMVDPDAPSPDNATSRFILHWLAANLTQQSATSTTSTSSSSSSASAAPSSSSSQSLPASARTLANATADFSPYRPPAPPTDSAAHRYIIYAFRQPGDGFAVPAAFASFEGGATRANFNLTGFVAAAGLGSPAAAEYFYVSREPAVPGDFVALPGGVFPGGNGDAVFAGGSGANATATATGTGGATGSSSTAGATASGSASASGSATAAAAPGPEPVLGGSGAGVAGMLGAGLLGLAALL